MMKSIILKNVNPDYIPLVEFLYDLLVERDPVANISHHQMPTFEQHHAFVKSKPYRVWYIIYADDDPVGSVYLTKKNEIGIFIIKSHQGNGYGKQAIRSLMELHPEKQFLANIAPGNSRSIAMFEGLGFDLIQFTFSKEMSHD
jgi:RimJ/RimL family protein N-acetyltransferase